MSIPVENSPVTRSDLEALFKLLTRIDGHPRDIDDIDTWSLAARSGRWSRAQLAAAMLTLNVTFRGFRVMPGHVAEQIVNQREQIRTRWYCPDPPRELAEDPEAEIEWRRRVAVDFTDRALLALASGQSLDDVPLVTDPEPRRDLVTVPVERIAAALGHRKAVGAAPVDGRVPACRAPLDPARLASARAELDATRREPA
jgi:hypothetical protein